MRGEGLGVRVWGQGQGQGEGQEQRERESRAAGPRGEPHARVRPRPQCPARAWVGTVGPEPSARAWSLHTKTRGVREAPGHTPWPGSGLVAVLGAFIVQRFLMYTAPAVAALGPTPGSRFPVSLLYTSAAALQRVQFLAIK